MARKGDFTTKLKQTLARRVNDVCSNPQCDNTTSGPHYESQKYTLSGEAAHINSASPNGPRYNRQLSEEFISSIDNGIWLCRNCHAVVDSDDCNYTAEELLTWKQNAEETARKNQISTKRRAVAKSKPSFKELWVHETTNDSEYVPRQEVLKKLDGWVTNSSVKVITVTGIGGQGKTSLVGHWLQNGNALTCRNFEGLFYWSFYSEQNVQIFFKSLLSFAHNNYNLVTTKLREQEPLEALRFVFSKLSLCIVLDGLEVIQYELSSRSKGQFIDGDLRNFLMDICLSKKDSLAVLTSRFDIVDLRQFSKQVNHLQLSNLTNSEAQSLLQRLFVGGSAGDYSKINSVLEGHPLALRVFAAGLPREKQANPISHLNLLMAKLPVGNKDLTQKINSLLSHYERSITNIQVILLSGVSLLHKPIDENSLLALSLKRLHEKSHTVEEVSVKHELSALVISGLVLKEMFGKKFRYSCHPIIREFFRNKVTNTDGQGRLVGEFLANRPSKLIIEDTETLEWLVSAIEVLSESGDWLDASHLYETKLKNGLIIKQLATPEYGWRCSLALSNVNRKDIRPISIFSVSPTSVTNTRAFYLNAAGQFSLMMGDLDNTIKFYNLALQEMGTSSSYLNRAITFQGLTKTNIQSGELHNAHHCLANAMEFASKRNPDSFFINKLHMLRGELHLLQGELAQAKTRFAKVFNSFKLHRKNQTDFRCSSAYGLAEIELNRFRHTIAERLLDEGDKYAGLNQRQDLRLKGHYLRGVLHYQLNEFEDSSAELKKAEKVARKSKMEYWLLKISIMLAMVNAKLGLKEKANVIIEDCVDVSSSRKFGILKVDSLIARAAISLGNSDKHTTEIATDSLLEANRLAESLEYHLAFDFLIPLQNLIEIRNAG